MKGIFGLFGFYAAAMVAFRIVYGAWPPHDRKFGEWLMADSKARVAMLVGIGAGMIGAIVGRAFAPGSGAGERVIHEAKAVVRRGLALHENHEMEPAREAFERAIGMYAGVGRIAESAPVYGCLGKLLFDAGDLDASERALTEALALYQNRFDAGDEISAAKSLLSLISERRQCSDQSYTYVDDQYPFSLIIPPQWVRQELVHQFSSTGGRVAISHISHAATLNVSAGRPDRPEWASKSARASFVNDYVRNVDGRVGHFDVRTSEAVAGEANAVIAEYQIEVIVRGKPRRRQAGFISIMHQRVEYVMQWSAERHLESQTLGIISTFAFNEKTTIASA